VPDILITIGEGAAVGTLLESDVEPLVARKRWIAGQLRPKGRITLDEGAVRALRERGVSILAVGVIAATGDFQRGDMVLVTDSDGTEVAKGLVNYGGDETRLLLGAPSGEIEARLGYVYDEELIHRHNLVVV